MPRDGYTLYDLDAEHMLRLECARCGRAGQYRVSRLRERFGERTLPDVLSTLADCQRNRSMNDPCGVVYTNLPWR